MIKQNMKHLNRIFVVIDAILVAVALFVAWFIRIESGWMEVAPNTLSFEAYMRPLIFLIPAYLLSYNVFNLYRPHRTKSIYDELFNVLKANTVGILVFLGYLYIFREVDYSRKVLVLFYMISVALDVFERVTIRYILRRLRKQSRNLKHVVLVGFSDLAVEYSRRIQTNRHWGFHINGLFDNELKREYVGLYKQSVKVLGKLNDLGSYIADNDLDEVIITLPLDKYSQLEKIVDTCEKQGVFTRIIPDYYKVIPASPYIEDIDGLPMISIRKVPLNDLVKRTTKRSVDLLVSLAGLIILSPMFLAVAALIRMDSKGPLSIVKSG